MFGIGISELLVILLVCLLLFGANRLPEIGKSIGEGVREFKKSLKEIQDDQKSS
ncbi:MAG: twin-arginine translocase TatA/TatE family subunit [Candidatus Omnitrophota bacterium]